MKRLIVSLLVATMLLTGCVENSAPADTSQPPATDGNTNGIVLPNEPPADRTWISPGKVNVANFYPGGTAEYPITIHNGKDGTCSFLVSYRYPDHVAEGYAKPAPEAQDWIIIADSTPVLMPKETRDILIALVMPTYAISPASKWEFWISVIDTSQAGMVKTELCTRWLVSMRD